MTSNAENPENASPASEISFPTDLPGSGIQYIGNAPLQPLQSPSECKGITRISEDSSEIAFLLVENYNYRLLDMDFGSCRNFCKKNLFSL